MWCLRSLTKYPTICLPWSVERLLDFLPPDSVEKSSWCVGSSLCSGILFHNRFFSGSTSDTLTLTDCFMFLKDASLPHTSQRSSSLRFKYSTNLMRSEHVCIMIRKEGKDCVYVHISQKKKNSSFPITDVNSIRTNSSLFSLPCWVIAPKTATGCFTSTRGFRFKQQKFKL